MRRLASPGLSLLSFTALWSACADAGDDTDTDEVTAAEDDSGKADGSNELYVRAGETSLWMTQGLTRRDGANGPEFVLRGRTSRDLLDGRAFIFDDVYGDWIKKSARVFEVTFPVSTARGLADGVAQFVGLDFKPSATRPDALTARAIVRPRLHSFTGSSRIYLTAELTPVVRGGTVVYRIKGHTGPTDYASVVQVQIGDQWITETRVFDQTRFEIDLQPEQALELAGTGAELLVRIPLPTGIAIKKMKLGLSIKKLGFTAGAVEAVWPPIACGAPVRSCLLAQPDGTIDLAACGEAVAVNACAGTFGVFVDDVSFVATMDAVDVQLVQPAWRSDGIGLAGADRVEQFLDNARHTVESDIEHMFGRWYLSVATRDAVLARAVVDGLDTAAAHPVDLIEPHEPAAGNVAATRQVVADALLLHIGAMDLRGTEWGRTMEDLAHEFRTWHVQSIRNFRETISPQPYPSHPEWDVYIGDWLGAYVEVTVLKSTGTVVNVLLEID